MLKQIWIFSLLAIFSTGFAFAGTGYPEIKNPATYSDTTLKKDSAKALAAAAATSDPKQEFRDLFNTTAISNGAPAIQLNPMAISFVEDYTDKFGARMEEMKDWGKPYFDKMDAILGKYGLPEELKYLAVIESQLKTNARSWAGAVGPWQLMPATARAMGLRINRKVDERRDLTKSTQAASRYLQSLFEMYGDWLLVIAAYNGGPGKVNAAIKRSGSRDFWVLQQYLPTESRNHVKKFIATHYIMEGEGGITTLTREEAANNLVARTIDSTAAKTQLISGRYQSAVILKHISMDLVSFNRINPDFDRMIAANGTYELRLPAEKMELFLGKKYDILNESLQQILNPAAPSKTTVANP